MLSKVINGREGERAQAAVFASVVIRPQSRPPMPSQADNATADECRELREQIARLGSESKTAVVQAFDAGRRQGEQEARADLAPVIERMNASVADLTEMRQQIRRRAEKDVVDLSLLIAKRVLHRELSVDPNALNALARVVFERLTRSESYRLTVHPQFAEAMRSALPGSQASRVHIDADPGAPLGTFTIRSEEGLVDASVDAQLEEITRGLTDRLNQS